MKGTITCFQVLPSSCTRRVMSSISVRVVVRWLKVGMTGGYLS